MNSLIKCHRNWSWIDVNPSRLVASINPMSYDCIWTYLFDAYLDMHIRYDFLFRFSLWYRHVNLVFFFFESTASTLQVKVTVFLTLSQTSSFHSVEFVCWIRLDDKIFPLRVKRRVLQVTWQSKKWNIFIFFSLLSWPISGVYSMLNRISRAWLNRHSSLHFGNSSSK